MSTPLIHRPESNGASTPAVTAAAPGLTEYAFPATPRDIGAQASAVLGLLTGVWVALSPWFLTLQNTGTNANTVNLISGLAVAGVGALALLSPRGFAGLQVGSALRRRRIEIRDRHLRAAAEKLTRGGVADTSVATGDEYDFRVNCRHGGNLPLSAAVTTVPLQAAHPLPRRPRAAPQRRGHRIPANR